MKYLAAFFIAVLFVPMLNSSAEPAVPGTILTFYINDINLSTDHRAVMTISTSGLVDFTINGMSVTGQSTMVETGIDTGVFQVQLTLPDKVNGKSLKDGDVVVMTYHQKADYSGNPTTVTQSKVLSKAPSSPVSSSSSNVRLGNYFKLRIYAPDYNLDSFKPDDIPLDMIEVHMGGAQTTLAGSEFQTNPYTLRETGPNTDTFEVTVKMPKQIAGFPVEQGSTIEFRFKDHAFPSSVYLRVGSGGAVSAPSIVSHKVSPVITMYSTNSVGTIVDYSNSEILYGYVKPICSPTPGSFFNVGQTTVTCAAKDQNGNSVVKSFTVNVVIPQNKIPSWTKKPVSFWCDGIIDYSQLQSTMKYLSASKSLVIPSDPSFPSEPDKTGLCQWVHGQISDSDIASSLYVLSR